MAALDIDALVNEAFLRQLFADDGGCLICGSVVTDRPLHLTYHVHIDPVFAVTVERAKAELSR